MTCHGLSGLRVRGFERCFKVQFAAFHPIFFLHHANVDRIYEKHVQMETPEECVSLAAGRVLLQQSLVIKRETWSLFKIVGQNSSKDFP